MATPSNCVPGFETDDAPAPSPTKPDEKTIVLRGVRVPLASDVGGAFITDCARNRERLFNDDRLREKYEIDDKAWTAITQNKALRLLIAAECERRSFNNDAAREAAAKFFTQAPSVLNGILQDQKAPTRSRIEASKELRTAARAGDEKSGADAERVVVTINLGNAPEDKLVFDCGPPKPKEATDAEREW